MPFFLEIHARFETFIHRCPVPLGESTNIDLLEKIVADQRQILADVYNTSDVTIIPQLWALCTSLKSLPGTISNELMSYTDKEVQGYYEDGMRVPDDVVLLWTDDK